MPTYVDPPQQSVPYENSVMPMSVSPHNVGLPDEFQSPLEDRSTLLQSLGQPTIPSRSDAAVSAAAQTPKKRWKSFCTSYSATQQCIEGDQCNLKHVQSSHVTPHRQLSFERTPAPLSDLDGSAKIPINAPPVLSSPTPIQQELDRLKAQLQSRDQELHHAQAQLQKK